MAYYNNEFNNSVPSNQDKNKNNDNLKCDDKKPSCGCGCKGEKK